MGGELSVIQDFTIYHKSNDTYKRTIIYKWGGNLLAEDGKIVYVRNENVPGKIISWSGVGNVSIVKKTSEDNQITIHMLSCVPGGKGKIEITYKLCSTFH